MSERRGLTRQERLWWVAPTLRYWRDCLLEGKGSLAKNLPVLQCASNLGWYVQGAWDLTPANKVPSWSKSSSNLFRYGDGGAWTVTNGALWHPAPLTLNNLEGDADAERFWRFIGSAYERFMASEPEIASLWKDGETLLCGWDPLPPEDGRLPCKKRPENLPMTWFGDTEWIHLDEWTWRVERTDLRYDGMHADDWWETLGAEND